MLQSSCLELSLQAWALSCCMCACGEALYGTCMLALQAICRLATDLQLHQKAARQAERASVGTELLHVCLQRGPICTCLLALQAVCRLGADLQLHQRAARQATLEAERLQSLHQQLEELQAACQGSQAPGGGQGACLTERLDSARRAMPAVGCFGSQTLVSAGTQQAALACPAACPCHCSVVWY